MGKYIDAEKLIAKIERRRSANENENNPYAAEEDWQVLMVIYSLQQDHLPDAGEMVEQEHIADVSKMMEQQGGLKVKYIDAEKLIAEIERLEHENCMNDGKHFCMRRAICLGNLRNIISPLYHEQPEVDLEKEEYVGVAESPLKTFQRVNESEEGASYRH